MARKFGKREKLVVGFLALIGAIAAVHLLVFQRPAQSLADAQKTFMEVNGIAKGMPIIPKLTQQTIVNYERRTSSDERMLWNTMLNLNIVPSPNLFVFYKLFDLPKIEDSMAETKKQELKQMVKENTVRLRAYQAAAENLITERLERLIAMKKAYGAGAPWPGDLLTSPCQGVVKPVPVKLTFMDNKDEGWRLPIELKKELRDSRPKLWDEVRHLHDAWSVLNYLPQTNAQYPDKHEDFRKQLEQVGMPEVYQIHAIRTKIGREIPAFSNVLMALRILEQVPTGEPPPTVGLGDTLTTKLLQRMLIIDIPGLSTKMPRYYMLQTFNHQLIMLENLLPLARKNGVEEVSAVRLPSAANMVERVIKTIDPNDPTTARMYGGPYGMYMRPGMPGYGGPMSRPYGPGGPMGPMGPRGPYPMGPMGPLGPMGVPLISLKPEERLEIVNHGRASLVVIVFTASNQNAMNFLYDVVNDPRYFRIESLLITSVPREEKIKVTVAIEGLMEVKEVSSLLVNLVNVFSGAPLSTVGMDFWNARVAQARQRGLDEQKIIQDSFAKAGYSTKKPYVVDPKMVVTDEKDPTLEEPPPTPEPTPTPIPQFATPTPEETPAGGAKKKPVLAPIPDIGA